MNHLIAKLRLRGNVPKYKKLLSDVSLYELPDDFVSYVQYSPDHNLDEDSWFGIAQFSTKAFCLDFLKTPFNSAEYDVLNTIDVDKLDFLCSYQNENEYYFQNVTKAQLLSKKRLYLGDAFRYEENCKTIVINSIADAIYIRDQDILYFKRLPKISCIFKGMDVLYREATEVETADFLLSEFVQLDEEFSVAKVGKANRHRIAMALDTLNNFEVEQKGTVMDYIRDYCPDLEYQNNAFKIKSDDELKKLLYGIEQRYYTTPVGNEKRCANSIIRLY
ncbi:hypothetical protein [Desulfosporosinus meridiei]|uniref:ATP F0F1 synthase synthase n=1 Tax=Desulfosporosinus meridiei (strain ATCC BAA-275 / DSM 13257 / KCTC 12902 / NCIMB 13706 / S10) TaxID=768704 RepID=J7ITS6_DESMD|nr:hypothetical protein [Desulfosporosinus meridiei]AFQ45262.1 hypothetical protein Desmer_3406 [Desulfosporosinus meridiei DSM 13257]